MIKKTAFLVFLFCLYFGLFYQSTCHSQPAEKFIILNLHWNSNSVRLNALHIAEGVFKKKKEALGKNPFLYRVLSKNEAVIDEGYFEVPRTLHFDFQGDENEEMNGGRVERQESDFVIKIPAHKDSSKVLFYRLKNTHNRNALFSTSTGKEPPREIIGAINLK
jgi:hypothetical protein